MTHLKWLKELHYVISNPACSFQFLLDFQTAFRNLR